MKNLFLWLLMMSSNIVVQSQSTPLYIADTVDHTGIPVSHSASPFDNPGNLNQDIYYHSDFPGMPVQGQITDVYIKMSKPTPAGSKLFGLTIKMKPTGMNGFPQSWSVSAQIATGLTTVYYDSMFVLQNSLAVGDWLRLTLPVPYSYSFMVTGDSSRNLLVQLSQDSLIGGFPNGPTFKFNTYVYNYGGNVSPFRQLNSNVNPALYGVTVNNVLDVIGFNPKPDPTTAGEVSAIEKLTVYPNPNSGRFMISFDAGTQVKEVKLSVINMVGQKIIEERYQHIDKHFRKEVDLSSAGKGVYFVALKIDDERVVKKVVVQ